MTVLSNPTGKTDGIRQAAGGAFLLGWAFDADSAKTPATITVTEGSAILATGTAGLARLDVVKAHSNYPANAGFNLFVPLTTGGVHTLCAQRKNLGRR